MKEIEIIPGTFILAMAKAEWIDKVTRLNGVEKQTFVEASNLWSVTGQHLCKIDFDMHPNEVLENIRKSNPEFDPEKDYIIIRKSNYHGSNSETPGSD